MLFRVTFFIVWKKLNEEIVRDILKLTLLFELELYSVLGNVTFKINALQYCVTP